MLLKSPPGLLCTRVSCQGFSSPESLITEVARNGDSCQVVRFNVVPNVCPKSFFATNCADICLFHACGPIWNGILTLSHQRLHLFIQFHNVRNFHVANLIVLDSNCCFAYFLFVGTSVMIGFNFTSFINFRFFISWNKVWCWFYIFRGLMFMVSCKGCLQIRNDGNSPSS